MASLSMNIQAFPPQDEFVSRMDPAEICDRIQVMRNQEDTTYRCRDYLQYDCTDSRTSPASPQCTPSAKPIDEKCRLKMCEWCHQVASFCGYSRETVGIGISLLDRYLSTSVFNKSSYLTMSDRKRYQLAAMTTFYISVKLHEPVVMDVELLAEMSRGCYAPEDVETMEKEILTALGWRVNGPTALEFVQHYLSLLPTSVGTAVAVTLQDFSRYQTELAVSNYGFVTVNPSVIALAAVLNTMDGINATHFGFACRGELLRLISLAYGEIDRTHLSEVRMELSDCFSEASGGHDLRSFVSSQLSSNLVQCENQGISAPSTPTRVDEDDEDICNGVVTKKQRSISLDTKSPVCVASDMSNIAR